MGEVLLMLLTGGGSTALGAMLKGGFGFLFEARRQKHELELAREARGNQAFLDLQAQLNQGGNNEFRDFSRRVIAFIGISTLCACILLCTLFPSTEFLSITNAHGEGRTELLFGLISYPASQDPIILSSGHLAYMGHTALMGILGFYFGPSPRR